MVRGQVECMHCGALIQARAHVCYNCKRDLRAEPAVAGGAVTATDMATGGATQYNPAVIRSYAEHLYDRATIITVVYALLGALLLAGVFGAVGVAIGSIEAGLLVGALAGGGIGYFIGNMKANTLRLEAQLALCQVEIERNTRAA